MQSCGTAINPKQSLTRAVAFPSDVYRPGAKSCSLERRRVRAAVPRGGGRGERGTAGTGRGQRRAGTCGAFPAGPCPRPAAPQPPSPPPGGNTRGRQRARPELFCEWSGGRSRAPPRPRIGGSAPARPHVRGSVPEPEPPPRGAGDALLAGPSAGGQC